MGFPGGTVIKNPPANAGDARDVGQKDPLKKKMATPVFLPGQFYGQRSLHAIVHRITESDTTEHSHTHTHTAIHHCSSAKSQTRLSTHTHTHTPNTTAQVHRVGHD